MLQKPETPWTQSTLANALRMDPHTVSAALRHLQGLGLVEGFSPPAVGPLRAISLRTGTPLGAALLDFYKRISGQQGESLESHSNSNET